MTNVTAGAYADIPLFLFHLLEYMDVDYIIDVAEINQRWRDLAAGDVWAQLVMKEPGDSVERIRRRPAHRDLPAQQGRGADLSPAVARLAPADQRGRVLLPARVRPGRLPLQGRRPRHPRHQRPHADRRGPDRPVPALHRRHPFLVRHRADRAASGRYTHRVREVSARHPGPVASAGERRHRPGSHCGCVGQASLGTGQPGVVAEVAVPQRPCPRVNHVPLARQSRSGEGSPPNGVSGA